MSALIYFLIIMLTLLAFIVVLLALGLILAKIGPRRVSFRVLGYAAIGIGVAAAQGRPESLQIAGIRRYLSKPGETQLYPRAAGSR